MYDIVWHDFFKWTIINQYFERVGGNVIVNQQNFLDFLGTEGARFIIPAYQRVYSWNESQCEELWLDILRAGRSDKNHFLGTILYAQEKEKASEETVFSIIDGQQRMTSVSLILLALSRYEKTHGLDFSNDLAFKSSLDDIEEENAGRRNEGIRERFLWNESDTGEKILRFTPSTHDIEPYIAEIEGHEPSSSTSINRNLSFFERKMEEKDFDLSELLNGLNHLVIIAVKVEDPQAAQTIFEGINSKGMPLNVADMIRNYLLLAENHDEQTRMYEEYWKPSQEMFSPDPGSLRLNTGIKSWISIRLRAAKVLSPDLVYSSFKKYVEDEYRGEKEPILRELRGFCLMWAENYRYHGTKKYKSGSDWAELGAPALTANYKLKKADNEEYAERVRQQLKDVDSRW